MEALLWIFLFLSKAETASALRNGGLDCQEISASEANERISDRDFAAKCRRGSGGLWMWLM